MDEVAAFRQLEAKLMAMQVSLQIDVIQLELLQARLQSTFNIVHVRLINFASYEKLLALNTRLLNAGSELWFCLVHLCSIKMRVAQLDSQLHRVNNALVNLRLLACFVPGGAGAIAQHWD